MRCFARNFPVESHRVDLRLRVGALPCVVGLTTGHGCVLYALEVGAHPFRQPTSPLHSFLWSIGQTLCRKPRVGRVVPASHVDDTAEGQQCLSSFARPFYIASLATCFTSHGRSPLSEISEARVHCMGIGSQCVLP